MDAPLFRDDNNEEEIQQIIYASAREEYDSGGEDDFSSQFLNDSGEGLQFEDEVTLTTNSVEVYIYINSGMPMVVAAHPLPTVHLFIGST